MKDRIKLAVIGLGQRGLCMLKNPIIPMKEEGIDVVAVCDPLKDRVDTAVNALLQSGAEKPFPKSCEILPEKRNPCLCLRRCPL